MNMKMQARIAENIGYLRKISAYTREEVANYLHISRTSYSSCEAGSVLLELDKKKFIKQVTLQRMGGEQMNELTDTFFRLSPFAQGCLLERASMLLSLEKEEKKDAALE